MKIINTLVFLLFLVFQVNAEDNKFIGYKFKEVKIDADDMKGERIGSLKAGQHVSISYIKGKWTAYQDWEMESPDTAGINQHRIVIKRKGKKAEDDFVIVHNKIQNTKEKPYVFKIEEDGEYYISITDKVKDGNQGSVEYSIGISK